MWPFCSTALWRHHCVLKIIKRQQKWRYAHANLCLDEFRRAHTHSQCFSFVSEVWKRRDSSNRVDTLRIKDGMQAQKSMEGFKNPLEPLLNKLAGWCFAQDYTPQFDSAMSLHKWETGWRQAKTAMVTATQCQAQRKRGQKESQMSGTEQDHNWKISMIWMRTQSSESSLSNFVLLFFRMMGERGQVLPERLGPDC